MPTSWSRYVLLPVSPLSLIQAGAAEKGVPLYKYIAQLAGNSKLVRGRGCTRKPGGGCDMLCCDHDSDVCCDMRYGNARAHSFEVHRSGACMRQLLSRSEVVR
jgi:hypothetical protein